jgi:TatA/E family protein of Tat protein translocase
MFGPLGFPEMLFILVLALLIFGPKRLPEVGRTIGKGMAQFRKATSDLRRTIETEIALENEPPRPPGRPAGGAAQPRHAQLQLPGASLPQLGPMSERAPAGDRETAATGEPAPAAGEAVEVQPAKTSEPGESRPA